MPVPPFESPTPGPWQSFYGFQLPFSAAKVPEQQRPICEHFLTEFCAQISNLSFEYKFDEEGNLCYRCRDHIPDAGREGLSPQKVHNAFREFFLRYGVEPSPPPFAPFQPQPRTEKLRSKTRFGLSRLFEMVGLASSRPPKKDFALPSTWAAQRVHAQRQFELLQDWIRSAVQSSAFLSALDRWKSHLRESKKLLSPQIVLAPNEHRFLRFKGTAIEVTVGPEPTCATLAVPKTAEGVTISFSISRQEKIVDLGSFCRLLQGLCVELRDNKVKVFSQAEPLYDATDITGKAGPISSSDPP